MNKQKSIEFNWSRTQKWRNWNYKPGLFSSRAHLGRRRVLDGEVNLFSIFSSLLLAVLVRVLRRNRTNRRCSVYKLWRRGLTNLNSVEQPGRLEAQGRVNVAAWVQTQEGILQAEFLPLWRTSVLSLKAFFNCLDAAHSDYGEYSALLKIHWFKW